MKMVRCAIYTRKSSDEGLEQGFNSLHAQREACAAYIMSQASEGWTLMPDEYDDGGISGGTLDRPALQQLLADVADGRIDIIVVYKVDRLTRSLLDFAKLVEALDKAGTSFVSITQSFNTTTSMGRLTLNMLLSFAQFEREVTAERIRDKLAASKAKGMWMGGVPPLGYKPDGRSLAIVEDHAALVRLIYDLYRELGNVRLVADRLIAEGIDVPVRMTSTGRRFGGGTFSRGQLYAILGNPIYAGDIPHRNKVYPGNHQAIIERALWDQVQRQLAGNVKGHRTARHPGSSWLAGRILDASGEPLTATHTINKGRRYRYYVSKSLHHGASESGMRIPAGEIEHVITQELITLLEDPVHLAERARLAVSPSDLMGLVACCRELTDSLHRAPEEIAGSLVAGVRVLGSGIEIDLAIPAISQLLEVPCKTDAPEVITLSCKAHLTRTGRAVRLVQDNGSHATGQNTDPVLMRLLLRARAWWAILAEGKLDLAALARREGVTHSYVTRVVRLAFLSPQVVEGIMAGRLRAGMDGKALQRFDAISADWDVQELQLLVN